jgi:hypothetical protein
MTDTDVLDCLKAHGVQPRAHRVAIARYVLATEDHPSADDVWDRVRRELPVVSRATVYNTLNLLVEKGLLRQLSIAAGHVVRPEGRAAPPSARRDHGPAARRAVGVQVSDVDALPGFEVTGTRWCCAVVVRIVALRRDRDGRSSPGPSPQAFFPLLGRGPVAAGGRGIFGAGARRRAHRVVVAAARRVCIRFGGGLHLRPPPRDLPCGSMIVVERITPTLFLP